MLGISKLRNPVRPYPWGSRTAIPELLGYQANHDLVAEVWMGAHSCGSSEVCLDGEWTQLYELVRRAPEAILGSHVQRWNRAFPFLFKVLAAERPLSIQAHPDRRQAALGFARENDLDIPVDAPHRCYRDAHHKPEILYALSDFCMLRGFRDPRDITLLLQRFGMGDLLASSEATTSSEEWLKDLFTTYLSLTGKRLAHGLATALAAAEGRADDEPLAAWILRLQRQFPGDRGVLAPLFLQLLELAPGEAVYTGPGVLHAYLRGTGIELMSNSDNVLRGGLTGKHIDIPELLRVLRCRPEPLPAIAVSEPRPGERLFETPVDDFALSILQVEPPAPIQRDATGGVEILLCTAGHGTIAGSAEAALEFRRGDSFFVPASVTGYSLSGDATLFKAAAPPAPATESA